MTKIIRLSEKCTTVDQIIREVCGELIKSLDSIDQDKKYTDQFMDIISQRDCTPKDFDNSLTQIRDTFKKIIKEPSSIRDLPAGPEKSLFSTALNHLEPRFSKSEHNRHNLAKVWKRLLINNQPILKIS